MPYYPRRSADNLTGHVGDPTDTSIKLRPLEPASGQALARDLVLKTRRRKGLGDQIAVSKYLDDEFVVSTICRFYFIYIEVTHGHSWLYLLLGTPTFLDNLIVGSRLHVVTCGLCTRIIPSSVTAVHVRNGK